MVGFVVPIKSKYVSRDWILDNHLLERTMRSICAQADQNFRLFIVYNDNYITPGSLEPQLKSLNLKLPYWLNI